MRSSVTAFAALCTGRAPRKISGLHNAALVNEFSFPKRNQFLLVEMNSEWGQASILSRRAREAGSDYRFITRATG